MPQAEPAILPMTPEAAAAHPTPATAPLPGQLIRQAELQALLSVSKPTFSRLKAAGKIGPEPIRLAGLKYDLAEVQEWLRRRKPNGELLDSAAWAATWAALQKRR